MHISKWVIHIIAVTGTAHCQRQVAFVLTILAILDHKISQKLAFLGYWYKCIHGTPIHLKDAARTKLGGHESSKMRAFLPNIPIYSGVTQRSAPTTLLVGCKWQRQSQLTSCHLASTPLKGDDSWRIVCVILSLTLIVGNLPILCILSCLLPHFLPIHVHENHFFFWKPGGHDRVFVSMVAAPLALDWPWSNSE